MKAYLDNNIVSAIAKDDIAAESAAIDTVLAAFDDGRLELVTSDVTRREIDNYNRASSRRGVERIFHLLAKVPYVESSTVVGFHSSGDARTSISYPLMEDDPTVTDLRRLGVEPTDAHHLMLASKAGCDIFLTCDGGILHRSRDVKTACGTEAMKPSALCLRQGW
jgi:hypothetical protein